LIYWFIGFVIFNKSISQDAGIAVSKLLARANGKF
jgi:hypothetical protein